MWTGWLGNVLNNLAWDVVNQVWGIASGNFGQILIFIIAIWLLFTIVNYFRRK